MEISLLYLSVVGKHKLARFTDSQYIFTNLHWNSERGGERGRGGVSYILVHIKHQRLRLKDFLLFYYWIRILLCCIVCISKCVCVWVCFLCFSFFGAWAFLSYQLFYLFYVHYAAYVLPTNAFNPQFLTLIFSKSFLSLIF